MSDTVIKVENISKLYRLGEVGTGTLRHDFNHWWHKVRGKEDPYLKIGERRKENGAPPDSPLSALHSPRASHDYLWALKDVSFEVKRGEVLGIIGRNGAGKSTLLKILSRVTSPTSGEIKVKGRIASLLEVGTGFNPELTGRDNIYLNGAILGMRKREIDRKFDEIVDFSGVERYIDTPVKRYSSGMYVRLAFAVAAHLEPEILIVDEVLAVGDAEFQKKCLGKIKDVAGHGRTVLFVSHNMAAVRTLCGSAMLIEAGKLRLHGNTNSTVNCYLAQEGAVSSERRWGKHDAPGDAILQLHSVGVRGACKDLNYFPLEEDVFLDIEYEVLQPHPSVCVSIHLYTEGVCAFVGGNSSSSHEPGIFRASCRIPQHLLNNNLYYVTVFLITNTTEQRVIIRDVVCFSVEESAPRAEYVGRVIGLVRPRLEWNTVKVESRFEKVS